MAKISIDLKTSSGGLPEGEILIPTPGQVTQAFAGALFTIKLLGEAAELLEVIKIDFSQLRLDETHTREGSVLVLRLTAIMSDWRDKDHKFNACMEIKPSKGKFFSKEIARELSMKINMAISVRIGNTRSIVKALEGALKSSIKASDAYLSKSRPIQPGHEGSDESPYEQT